MPTTYAKNKDHIYKWRDNHREQYNSYMVDKNKSYYEANAEVLRRKKLDHYYAVKELAVFRNILL